MYLRAIRSSLIVSASRHHLNLRLNPSIYIEIGIQSLNTNFNLNLFKLNRFKNWRYHENTSQPHFVEVVSQKKYIISNIYNIVSSEAAAAQAGSRLVLLMDSEIQFTPALYCTAV